MAAGALAIWRRVRSKIPKPNRSRPGSSSDTDGESTGPPWPPVSRRSWTSVLPLGVGKSWGRATGGGASALSSLLPQPAADAASASRPATPTTTSQRRDLIGEEAYETPESGGAGSLPARNGGTGGADNGGVERNRAGNRPRARLRGLLGHPVRPPPGQ